MRQDGSQIRAFIFQLQGSQQHSWLDFRTGNVGGKNFARPQNTKITITSLYASLNTKFILKMLDCLPIYAALLSCRSSCYGL
jgi:hypothetical protein